MNTLIKLGTHSMIMLCAAPAFSYPKVHIKNNTNLAVQGKVYYLSEFGIRCTIDTYKIDPQGSYKGPYRGGCLINMITVHYRNHGQHSGKYFLSKGSFWAYFAIDKTSDDQVEVKHSP